MVTVRALLATTVHSHWHISQLDINNAFLYGDLIEDVYMTLPQGYLAPHSKNNVYKLQKSLYGLKQANRQWFIKLTTFLLHLGFQQSYADTSLFTLKQDHNFLCLLVYVDDILLTGNNITLINTIKQHAISTIRNSVLRILSSSWQTTLPNHHQARHSLAAQTLSQFSQAPRIPHLKALIKVLRYLKSWTRSFLPSQHKYAASCPIVTMTRLIVVFQEDESQGIAEYRALADTTCVPTWIRCLFKDLGISISSPIPIYFDNASAIALAFYPIQHVRTKDIEIDWDFVRDKIRDRYVLTKFISTKDQAAHIPTKGISKASHYHCLSKFRTCDPYTLPICREGNGLSVKEATVNTSRSRVNNVLRVNITKAKQQLNKFKTLRSCGFM
ncbi:retrovirus-related pol polyprotein from transposon TNT 1-94 [Tanacetum coccineum]